MDEPSRRTVLRWIGMFAPFLGVQTALGSPGLAHAPRPNIEDEQYKQALRGLGGWMSRNGVTIEALNAAGGALSGATGNLQKSFSEDPVILVDGFMFPTGFCRYCLAVYARNSIA